MNSLVSDHNPDSFAHADAGAQADAPAEALRERPAPPDVFQYEDYRVYLRDRFQELQAANPAFSQRGLARKAGIANPGFFNEVIKGRRRLSPAAALKMAYGLDLSREETEYFSALVDWAESREPRARLSAGKRMMALKNRKLYRAIQDLRSPTEALKEIMRELDREWVVQAAGLDVHPSPGGEGPGTMVPMGETTLQGILDRLVDLRGQIPSDQEPVVHFNLQMAPRHGAKPGA